MLSMNRLSVCCVTIMLSVLHDEEILAAVAISFAQHLLEDRPAHWIGQGLRGEERLKSGVYRRQRDRLVQKGSPDLIGRQRRLSVNDDLLRGLRSVKEALVDPGLFWAKTSMTITQRGVR